MSASFPSDVNKAKEVFMTKFDSATKKQDLSKPGREIWVPDADVSACFTCTVAFTFFKRKHHCRECGQVFCYDCTNYKIEVQRSHYGGEEEKERKVCKSCYERKMGEKENRPSIGLNRVAVTGVDNDLDSSSTQNGRRFFFEPDEWSSMIGVDSGAKAWAGKPFHVMQFRSGACIWAGNVSVNRVGAACRGQRSSGDAYGQWQNGDIIHLAGEAKTLLWKKEDSRRLVGKVDMFDGSILHINFETNLETALERLNPDVPKTRTTTCSCFSFFAAEEVAQPQLASHKERCDEGICIAHCQDPRENHLLVRQDQKKQGQRIFEEYECIEEARESLSRARSAP